ncbi:hypothetical protein ACFY1P_21815 [Streptomyces sp. NPDC001407]|uniref:hypothetical protein n=1 Tax=unclassified Streptomyces TaxID=2593676 RepID=UPI0036A4C000
MGRPSRAVRAAITQRRTDAIDLKIAGVDWLTIGRKLAADPAVNSDGVAYPQGYGAEKYQQGLEPPTDKQLIDMASRDLREALDERAAALGDSTDQLRQLMMERLEKLFFPMYRQAIRNGDYQAVDRAVRIIERECRLLGLDQPTRTELSGPDGAPVQVEAGTLEELERLIGLAGGQPAERAEG